MPQTGFAWPQKFRLCRFALRNNAGKLTQLCPEIPTPPSPRFSQRSKALAFSCPHFDRTTKPALPRNPDFAFPLLLYSATRRLPVLAVFWTGELNPTLPQNPDSAFPPFLSTQQSTCLFWTHFDRATRPASLRNPNFAFPPLLYNAARRLPLFVRILTGQRNRLRPETSVLPDCRIFNPQKFRCTGLSPRN